jgi:nickel transport protein
MQAQGIWRQAAVVIGLLLLWPQTVPAHGTEGAVCQGGWVVEAKYVGGEVMSFAKVTVTAPKSDKPFQTGRTDRNGKFAFVPDAPGTWRLVVDDEMGHRLTMAVEVPAASLAGKNEPPAAAANARTSLASRALFGVGLLMLLAGLAAWWQAKKLSGQGDKGRSR